MTFDRFRTDGRRHHQLPVWSAGLAARHGTLTVDGAGGCLAASPDSLMSFTPDGRHAWTAGTEEAWEPPVLGPGKESQDRGIYRIEGDYVVARAAGTGAITGSFRVGRARHLTAGPNGRLLLCQVGNGDPALRCVTVRGEHCWTAPLPGGEARGNPPVVLGGLVIAHCGGLLRGFDDDGRVRWLMDHAGFRAPGPRDGAAPAAGAADQLVLPPHPLDRTTFLVGLEWPRGRGLFRADPVARTVEPFAEDIPVQPPIAVVPGRAGHRVAMRGARHEVRRLEWEWPVLLIDPTGRRVWAHDLPTEPVQILAGRDGSVVISATLSQERWDQYHKWHDLSQDTFVRCVDAEGTPKWTWYAPGPLSHLPVVRPDGAVYVGSGGRLWALPPG